LDLVPGVRAVLHNQQFVSQSLADWRQNPGSAV
jgi:hypothetical protein